MSIFRIAVGRQKGNLIGKVVLQIVVRSGIIGNILPLALFFPVFTGAVIGPFLQTVSDIGILRLPLPVTFSGSVCIVPRHTTFFRQGTFLRQFFPVCIVQKPFRHFSFFHQYRFMFSFSPQSVKQMDAGKEQHYAEEKNDHYGNHHKQGGSVFFLFHRLL